MIDPITITDPHIRLFSGSLYILYVAEITAVPDERDTLIITRINQRGYMPIKKCQTPSIPEDESNQLSNTSKPKPAVIIKTPANMETIIEKEG